MKKLMLKGITEVEGMKFHHIEGGFGEGKRSILIREIAQIYDRKVSHINELINNNRKRFKDGIDIVDLLGVGMADSEIKEFGFSQQAINSYRGLRAKGLNSGIYTLSERGYSKLLKIMEDDLAWDQYEKLVDGYFNMREKFKLPKTYTEALRELADEAEKNEQLQIENKQKEQIIGELKPKADYVDTILKNKGLVNISQIAKDYGMSGQAMNALLHDFGVQYKQGKQWLLYHKYHNKGYTHSETINITHKDGRPDVKMRTKWTQKGRLFLYELLKKNNIHPTIEIFQHRRRAI